MKLKAVQKALVPSTPSLPLKFGDRILVYGETTGRWEPRTFVSRNEHNINVLVPNRTTQPYAKTRVREYKEVLYLPTPNLYRLNDGAKSHTDSQKSKNHAMITLPAELNNEESIKLDFNIEESEADDTRHMDARTRNVEVIFRTSTEVAINMFRINISILYSSNYKNYITSCMYRAN